MPSDFIVLRDEPLQALSSAPGPDKAGVAIVIPEDMVVPHHHGDGGLYPTRIGPAVLAYMIDPSDDAKDLVFEIQYHHLWFTQYHGPEGIEELWTPITRHRLTGGVRRGYWEVISSKLIRPSVPPYEVPGHPPHLPNEEGNYRQNVSFTVLSGHGSVVFSDIVLFFRW
jgi:hypothetical protein